jgi:acyl carrier protein
MKAQFTLDELMDLLVANVGLPASSRTDRAEAHLADLGLDSLAFLQLQATLEDRFGFELPDDGERPYTVGEIVATVNEGLRKRATGMIGRAGMTGHAE